MNINTNGSIKYSPELEKKIKEVKEILNGLRYGGFIRIDRANASQNTFIDLTIYEINEYLSGYKGLNVNDIFINRHKTTLPKNSRFTTYIRGPYIRTMDRIKGGIGNFTLSLLPPINHTESALIRGIMAARKAGQKGGKYTKKGKTKKRKTHKKRYSSLKL